MVTGHVVKVVKTLCQKAISLRSYNFKRTWVIYISVVVVITTGVDV